MQNGNLPRRFFFSKTLRVSDVPLTVLHFLLMVFLKTNPPVCLRFSGQESMPVQTWGTVSHRVIDETVLVFHHGLWLWPHSLNWLPLEAAKHFQDGTRTSCRPSKLTTWRQAVSQRSSRCHDCCLEPKRHFLWEEEELDCWDGFSPWLPLHSTDQNQSHPSHRWCLCCWRQTAIMKMWKQWCCFEGLWGVQCVAGVKEINLPVYLYQTIPFLACRREGQGGGSKRTKCLRWWNLDGDCGLGLVAEAVWTPGVVGHSCLRMKTLSTD